MRRRHRPKAIAPLLKQTGDRTLERSLHDAHRSGVLPMFRNHVKGSHTTASLPRKRQRQNLKTYSKLAAKSTYVLSDADDDEEDSEPWQTPKASKKRFKGSKETARKKPKTKHAVIETRPKRPTLPRGTRLRQSDVCPNSENTPSRGDPDTPYSGLGEQRRKVLQALTRDTGLGDSSLGDPGSHRWLEANTNVDVESTTDQQEDLETGEADDEVDALEKVEINGDEHASERCPSGYTSAASAVFAQAASPSRGLHVVHNGVFFEASTPFSSPSAGLPGAFGALSPLKPIAQPFLSPAQSPPAYPVSAERSRQQQQSGRPEKLPQLPTTSTTPTPLFLARASTNTSGASSSVPDPSPQQFESRFVIPRARVASLSPWSGPLDPSLPI